MVVDPKTCTDMDLLGNLDILYEQYDGPQLESIRNRFMEFLIETSRTVTGQDRVSKEVFTLITDLRMILEEIVGNGLRHGINPSCSIRKSAYNIVIRVVNERCGDDNGIYQNCGRGMAIIKSLIREHSDIRIIHSHSENAYMYKALLIISLEDFTNYIKQYSKPQA